jgi:putative MATE family efflux protein
MVLKFTTFAIRLSYPITISFSRSFLMFEKIFGDKIFLRNLGLLALPIIINELINSSVNLMDTFMTGKLGAQSVTAVGLGNQVFFLFVLITFGISSGASVFMGQYWGKGNISGIHKVLGIAILLAFADATVFFCGACFFPEAIMRIYSKDSEVIALGCSYLRIVGFSYFLTAVTVTINAALKAMGQAAQPMVTTFISLVCNIVFNYIFIFRLGMGVRGAALGTLLARSIELTVQLCIVFMRRHPIITAPKHYFEFDKAFLSNYFKIASPVLINEFMWALGTSIYNIAYKYSGTVPQAAVQIANVVQNLFAVVGMGIGTSCGILVANALGAGDNKRAQLYSSRCTVITVIVTIVTGCILALSSGHIVELFSIEPVGRHYAYIMLLVVAVGMLFKNINYINIVGILRNGGDTLFCLLVDTCSVWLIGVPMAFLGSAILHLPIYITFAMVYSEEFFKTILSGARVKSGKWIKDVI